MRTHTWLDYVPSLANIADLPSRGDFELLERLGARRVERPVVGTADWHGHNATSSGGGVRSINLNSGRLRPARACWTVRAS